MSGTVSPMSAIGRGPVGDHFSCMETRLKSGLQISRTDRKHMLQNTFFKLFMYALVFT